MKTKEKLIIFTIIMMILLLVLPNTVNAALQSNGGTPKTYDVNTWLINIRNMQATGGTLGLTDTISRDLTSNNTNLDIHMEKNTEYGALVILSASAYGKPNKVNSGDTTTGNSTGVVMNINKERVSAGCAEYEVTNFQNAVGRYKNIYTINYVEKKGDAILRWHDSLSSSWFSTDYGGDKNGGLLRSYSGSVFSYYAYAVPDVNWPTVPYSSRAVVVVGSGI